MNTSPWRLWTICVCQGPGLLPVRDSTHTGRFTPSSISQRAPHPQGVELIFTRPQEITKRQCGKHGIFEKEQISTLLLCRGSCVLTVLCPCACCAIGTKRNVPSKINQNQHMLQSSSIKCFPAEPPRQGWRYSTLPETISSFRLAFLSQLGQMQPNYRKLQ